MTHLEVYESIYASLVRRYGEDAAQDAGEKLVTHPPRSDDPSRVIAWLHQVARHAQVNGFRKVHRERVSTDDALELLREPTTDPRAQIEARLQLRELPRDLAQAIVDTLDTPSNGTSTKAVKLHRLRKRLRERGNGEGRESESPPTTPPPPPSNTLTHSRVRCLDTDALASGHFRHARHCGARARVVGGVDGEHEMG